MDIIKFAEKVTIGRNVFLGSSGVVMKGVTTGDNTVISTAVILTKSILDNVIAGGIPAKVFHFI